MQWVVPAQWLALVSGTVLVIVFGYLAATTRERHLIIWTWAWVLYTARLAIESASSFGSIWASEATSALIGFAQLLNIASGVLLLVGTMHFVERRVRPEWYVASALFAVWTVGSLAAGLSSTLVLVPGFVFLGVVSIMTGRAWITTGGRGWPQVVGWTFVIWGLHRFNFPFLRTVEWFAPIGYALAAGLAYVVAFGVLIAHFDRVRVWLLESERRYRQLFDQSKSVMMLVDPRDGAIVDANEAAEQYYGWLRADLCSMTIFDINTLSPEAIRAEMQTASEERRGHFFFTHAHADGTASDVEVYSGPVDVAGRQLLYSIVHDITARREAERELAEYKSSLMELVEARTQELQASNERLEAAQRTKDAFLANMSHELRTPLNSVIGFSGLLASGKAGVLTAEQVQQAEMIQASGRHLLALVNDLLDVSAIDSGATKPVFAVVDLCEVVSEFARQAEPLCREKGLAVSVVGCGTEDSCLLVTDRRFVEQVLWNLAGNAIKFTEEGTVTLEVVRKADGVSIAVTDTGIGIAESDIGRIFDDFTQLDPVHGAKNLGTGLGLAISQRLAAMLDGHLEVTSEPGRGSTFTLHVVDHGRSRGAGVSPACD